MGRSYSFRMVSLAHDRRRTDESLPILLSRLACAERRVWDESAISCELATGRPWQPGRGPPIGGIRRAEGVHGVSKMLGCGGNGLTGPYTVGTQAPSRQKLRQEEWEKPKKTK